MNAIYSPGVSVAPTPGSWWTLAPNAVVHLVAVLLIVVVGRAAYVLPARARDPLTFVHVGPVVPPAIIARPLRVPPVATLDAPAPLPEFEKPREPKPEPVARVEPPKPEPREETAAIEPPRQTPAVVQVGAFETAAAQTSQRAREVMQAGFDASDTRTSTSRAAAAAVGEFEQSAVTAGPRPDRTGVADAGFGAGLATPGRTGGRSTGVADAGFGGGAVAAPSGPARGLAKPADFDARAVEPAAPKAARRTGAETPVEILAKPTPAYTDEARALHLEGDVLLEVQFLASGEIHVVRIVRGLGHGLDESAARAVAGIRFKPAQRDGQPVDVRTTINIVFRLA